MRQDSKMEIDDWIAKIMRRKKELLELADSDSIHQIPQWMFDALFVLGLDGDTPEEFPALTQAFYKGSANPMRLAKRAVRRWLNNGSY